MDTLSKLFSSRTLVKALRLFLFHPDTAYDADDIATRTKSQRKDVVYEMKLLNEVDLVKPKAFSKEVTLKSGKTKKKKTKGWVLNENFPYLEALRHLFSDMELIDAPELKRDIKRIGNPQLVVLSGVFMQDNESRVDMLIVANKVKKGAPDKAVAAIESKIGNELAYTLLSPDEFKYRMQVRDRLMRDIFSSPYTVLLNTRRFILPEVGML